jgi:hypothetical protein
MLTGKGDSPLSQDFAQSFFRMGRVEAALKMRDQARESSNKGFGILDQLMEDGHLGDSGIRLRQDMCSELSKLSQ